MSQTPVIHTPGELIAAVPHLLGFVPRESLVCVCAGRPGPIARVGLPRSDEDRHEVARTLTNAYRNHPGPAVLVAFTDDHEAARRATQVLQWHSQGTLTVLDALRADSSSGWVSLHTGAIGTITDQLRSRFTAEAVADGRPPPLSSREGLATQLRSVDPGPVAGALPDATAQLDAIASSGAKLMAEQRWIEARIGRFVGDPIPLADHEAARLLADMTHPRLRDAALAPMRRDDAHTHAALWSDLTRRAPTQVKAPAAALLGFAAWLSGDGARGWVALHQIPEDNRGFPLARLVDIALTHALDPHTWEHGPAATPGQDGHAGPRPELVRRLGPPQASPPSVSRDGSGPDRGAP